jgi:hypothetical protein
MAVSLGASFTDHKDWFKNSEFSDIVDSQTECVSLKLNTNVSKEGTWDNF